MPVGVVFPKLDSKFAADVDVNAATRAVRFSVIRKLPWKTQNGDEVFSQELLFFARKRVKKLNDFIVNEQTIFHWRPPLSDNPKRLSISSNVANFEAGLSIFSASFSA